MQFCVYRLDDDLVVDVQSDMVEARGTRIVVPLLHESHGELPLRGLEPTIEIEDERYVLLTAEIAAVPATHCTGLPIADLREEQDRIKAALDFLIYGF